MAKGWGYGRKKSQEEKAVDGFHIKTNDENFKVYQSLNNLYRGCNVSIRILFNKKKRTIKVVMTGTNMMNNRIEPMTADVTSLKTLSNIKN